MFQRWQEAVDETETDLNVIPVMNLFMVLIPFLLLGAAFYQIGVIPTSTPTHDPQESDVPKTPKTVAMNIVLGVDELSMSASSTSLTPEELEQLRSAWPAPGGNYDLPSLRAELIDIKARYPESTTVTILPHDDLQYQDLVLVLDTTREYEDGALPGGEPRYRELFPVTVFSRLLKEEQGEEGALNFAEEEE